MRQSFIYKYKFIYKYVWKICYYLLEVTLPLFLYVRCIIFATVSKTHNYRQVRMKLLLANLLVSVK
uniref:Uncharacterized protein n=1 Tax=Aegilops tauschii subsp. strangulata TaxID=200361 RepID=A0A453B9X9_AEGTS